MPQKCARTNEGTFNVNSQQDLGPAQNTYNGFIGLMKYGTIAATIVTAIVVLIIS